MPASSLDPNSVVLNVIPACCHMSQFASYIMLKCVKERTDGSFRMDTREESMLHHIHLLELAMIHLLICDIIFAIDILYHREHPINCCSPKVVFMMYPWHQQPHALSDRNLRLGWNYSLQIKRSNGHCFSLRPSESIKIKWCLKIKGQR